MLNDHKARNLITCEDVEGFKQLQFVKAGAGAGKTTSIKLRVLNLIKKKDLIPERMVTITYTTKAANELMTKIREILEKELKNKDLPQEDRPKVEAALATLTHGKISTFHSFCYDLLREYPVEFGVDPDAEIGDERGQDTIYQACFDQMCEELLIMKGHPKEKFLEILKELRDLISDKVIKEVFVILFANRDLQAELVVMNHKKIVIHAQLKNKLGKYLDLAFQIDNQVKDTSDTYYRYYYKEIKPFIDRFKNEKGFDLDAMAQAFLDEEEAPITASKGAKGKYNDQNYITSIKEVLKEAIEFHNIYQAVNKVESYNLCVGVFPYFKELVDAYKQNYGILDFFDCLYKVKAGLEKNPSLRHLIQKRFDTIIVDEFQDSDPMQVAIAFMLAEDDETKLFFVGDPKQSIYGFARADIAVYQKVMEEITTKTIGKILNLSTNFRSSPAILNFINDNFKQLLLRDAGFSEITVDYDQMDVCPDNSPLVGSVTKWTLKMETDSKLNVDDNRERESFVVGIKIKKMIDNGYKPGDFLILFRTGTAMGAYEDALEKLHIPVINTKSKDFLSKSEVIDMLNIISHVAFPTDAYFKACAEQSPFYKVASPETFQKILDSEMSLMLKVENIFNLCELKESSLQYGDSRLINLKTNLLSLLEVELDSTEHNLKKTIKNLYEKATTDSFITSNKLNDESIYLETRTPDAVRLMTVHASKGLESKVVILATHSQTKDMGGCHFIDRANSTFYPNCSLLKRETIETLGLIHLAQKLNYLARKTSEEERRVLYVAATRAIQDLIILDTDGKKSKLMEPLMNLVDIKFSQTETLNFADFEKDFNQFSIFKSHALKKIESAFNAGASAQILAVKPISQSVTNLIEDKALFQNIDGRKWGMEFGILTHKVLEAITQHIFINQNTQIEVEKLIWHFQKDMEASFDPEDIEELRINSKKFLSSSLATEIMGADEISTEIPFVLEGAYHGIIDLLILKDKKVKIIDWKSDQLKIKADEIKAHYKKQIQLYVEAVNQIVPGMSEGECVFIFSKS